VQAASASAGPVCALFDARRGEVYAGCYEGDGSGTLRTLMEPAALGIDALLDRMAGVQPLYVGEGAERYGDRLARTGPVGLAPRASALLRLAAADAGAGGRVADTAGWEPAYLRAAGAERGLAG
jgi:tRNA A37 threonylcarbamoyladenosine modification protein TsaB